MYVYIYICTYVYVYIYIYVKICVYINMCIYINICVYMYVYNMMMFFPLLFLRVCPSIFNLSCEAWPSLWARMVTAGNASATTAQQIGVSRNGATPK